MSALDELYNKISTIVADVLEDVDNDNKQLRSDNARLQKAVDIAEIMISEYALHMKIGDNHSPQKWLCEFSNNKYWKAGENFNLRLAANPKERE